jgi:hypothetical protein
LDAKKVCKKIVEDGRRRRDANTMKAECKRTCRDYLLEKDEKGELSPKEKSRMESELPECSAVVQG